jgi:hypothetical protein
MEPKVPPEMLSGDVDLYKATVASASYRGVDGAVLSAPTSISNGLEDIYRAATFVPKLQAERVRQQEAMKKGGDYSQRAVQDSELQAPPDYLAMGTSSNPVPQAPLCLSQQQQHTEGNALEEALSTMMRNKLPISSSARALQKAADPSQQPALTRPPQFSTLTNPATKAASPAVEYPVGGMAPQAAPSPKNPPPLPSVQPDLLQPPVSRSDLVSILNAQLSAAF